MSVEMKEEIGKFKTRMILNLILVRSVADCVTLASGSLTSIADRCLLVMSLETRNYGDKTRLTLKETQCELWLRQYPDCVQAIKFPAITFTNNENSLRR